MRSALAHASIAEDTEEEQEDHLLGGGQLDWMRGEGFGRRRDYERTAPEGQGVEAEPATVMLENWVVARGSLPLLSVSWEGVAWA